MVKDKDWFGAQRKLQAILNTRTYALLGEGIFSELGYLIITAPVLCKDVLTFYEDIHTFRSTRSRKFTLSGLQDQENLMKTKSRIHVSNMYNTSRISAEFTTLDASQ